MSKKEPKEIIDLHLIVFARQLVAQMRYNAYPSRWSSEPLINLLPHLYELLNYHSERVGDLIKMSYSRTFPEVRKGNINQLSTTSPQLFSPRNKQYYLDMYEAQETARPGDSMKVYLPEGMEAVLEKLGRQILEIYVSTASDQENTYRVLNTIVDSLLPLYLRTKKLQQFGLNLQEFEDYWPRMNQSERRVFTSDNFAIR